MNRLTLEDYRERANSHAAAVAETPGISGFCSGPLWQMAAHDHLHRTADEKRHLIVERDGTWLLFAEQDQPGVLFPFEAAWMFGCPLAGDPAAAAALLRDTAHLEQAEQGHPLAVFVGGLARDGAMYREILTLRHSGRGMREYPGMDVMIIDLSDGIEAWLGRRSKKFRRTLRSSDEATSDITLVDASGEDPDHLLARILHIQRQSYKWREGTDIFQMPEYVAFYRALLFGLHGSGHLRLLFARRDGTDLAHIFGGVSANTYRGLQMTYIEEARDLGLGNRLQLENLRLRAAEGVTAYDLGMHAPYKERWADRREERVGVFWVGS